MGYLDRVFENASEVVIIPNPLTFSGRLQFASGVASPLKIVGSTGSVFEAAPAATGYGLKIHTHSNTGSGGFTANEFKGEFLATSNTIDGVAAHYQMAATGTGIMRSFIATATLNAGKTLSGTDPATGSWISAGLFSTAIAATAVLSGTAIIATGLYSEVSTIATCTLTAVSHMSAAYLQTKLAVAPSSGESEILFLAHGGVAKVNAGIYVAGAGGGITHFLKFAAGDKTDGAFIASITKASTTTAQGLIKIDVAGTNYYICIYGDGGIDNEWAD